MFHWGKAIDYCYYLRKLSFLTLSLILDFLAFAVHLSGGPFTICSYAGHIKQRQQSVATLHNLYLLHFFSFLQCAVKILSGQYIPQFISICQLHNKLRQSDKNLRMSSCLSCRRGMATSNWSCVWMVKVLAFGSSLSGTFRLYCSLILKSTMPGS